MARRIIDISVALEVGIASDPPGLEPDRDAPFSFTAERFARNGDAKIIWEGHKAGREIGYCQIEKLGQLDQLPATGFDVACFPVKVKAASAGWTRAIAVIEE